MSEDLIKRFQEQGTFWATSAQAFVDEDQLEKLSDMTREEIDSADFGIIQVDDNGIIKQYNKYEANLAGLEISSVEGKNFFTQIAPCTNNRLFYGSFREGVAKQSLKLMFFYTFTYKMAPTNVKVFLYRNNKNNTNWILVKKN